jgi:hypothetical protein
MSTPQNVISMLAKVDGSAQYFSRKECVEIPSLLLAGEVVERLGVAIVNFSEKFLVATNMRLLLLEKLAWSPVTVEQVSHAAITAVQHKIGFVFGDITVFTANKKFALTMMDKTIVEQFANVLRSHINESTKGELTDGNVAKLERLAALREKGILSDEEFRQQKAAILGTPVEQPVMQATVVQPSPPPLPDPSLTVSDAEELQAGRLLDVARSQIKKGERSQARTTLEGIVERYPSTRAARTAHDALTKKAK